MAPLDQQLAEQFASAARALEAVRVHAQGLAGFGDDALVELIAASARNERIARAHSAVLAGELARRSAPELGHDGLAQKSGYRTPQKLIQAATGATARDAAQAVRVGELARSHPWLGVVARAVTEGQVSTDAADSIRAGLGTPSDDVPADALSDAASRLLGAAAEVDADRVFVLARDARDDLDAASIVDRERAARQARELRVHRLRDGSVRVVWQLDPVEGSVVSELYDRATQAPPPPAARSPLGDRTARSGPFRVLADSTARSGACAPSAAAEQESRPRRTAGRMTGCLPRILRAALANLFQTLHSC